jgi:hypothetical protein
MFISWAEDPEIDRHPCYNFEEKVARVDNTEYLIDISSALKIQSAGLTFSARFLEHNFRGISSRLPRLRSPKTSKEEK